MRMNTLLIPYRARLIAPKKQNGATLFFAMIGLVVLLLAAAALVRTVDTTTLIAGNLSFRMSATASGDRGMETAMTWLNTRMANAAAAAGASAGSPAGIAASITATNTSIPDRGYYSSTGEIINLFNNNTWTDAATQNIGVDNAGNTVRYVIERMCRNADTAPTEKHCIYMDMDPDESKQSGGSGETPTSTDKALIFRITARVEGPRNTVSYIQGFVY